MRTFSDTSCSGPHPSHLWTCTLPREGQPRLSLPHLPPGPASLAGLVVHFLPGPAVSGLQHPWPLPTRPPRPQAVPVLHPDVGICAGYLCGVSASPHPPQAVGRKSPHSPPSSPWDLQRVTASCWAFSPVKQAGLVQTLQKALSGADS